MLSAAPSSASADRDALERGIGRVEPEYSRFAGGHFVMAGSSADGASVPAAGHTALEIIAPFVDAAFYLASFAADAAARQDPVAHFHEIGWKLGRAPNPDFDTRYYLRMNDDVRAAGVNPLLHYLRFGRAEGRLPQRPGGARRALAEAATPPAARRPGRHPPPAAAGLDTPGMVARIAAACVGMRGLVVSVSHDRYIDITGGMQIFIADEQAQFNADRVVYLHIAPIITRLTLAGEGDEPIPLQLTLDGTVMGIALSDEVVAALAGIGDDVVAVRYFVLHSLFGHRCSVLAALSEALRPRRNFFWLHDYASLCAGYNLLRNDAVFCGAPPEGSMACRICVYGDGRADYRARVNGLFARVAFDVLAPSEAALAVWRQGNAGLAWRSTRVHPNALLRPDITLAARPGPIRVAFIGYPIPAKGWVLFLDLFRRARGVPGLSFYHFANPEALRPMAGLTSVPVKVDAHDRLAMADAIAAHDIDLVAMLAPWPETFSYVTREAIAGGADIVALTVSGGVAEAVRQHQRGVLFASEEAVLRFFLDGHVEAYVAAQRAAGRARQTLLACGTTATFDPLNPTLDPARLITHEPALVVIAGGTVVHGEAGDGELVFHLPAGTGEVRLLSRHVVPARLDPAGADYRRVGVGVAALALDGVKVPIGDDRRHAGWHGALPGDPAQWTSGDAALRTDGATRLAITLAASPAYQRCKLIPGE